MIPPNAGLSSHLLGGHGEPRALEPTVPSHREEAVLSVEVTGSLGSNPRRPDTLLGRAPLGSGAAGSP